MGEQGGPNLSSVPEEGRGLISRALGVVGSGINKVREFRQSQIDSMSPEERESYDKLRKTSSPGILGALAPSGVGPGSVASRVGVLRRFSPFRASGTKLAGQVERMSGAVGSTSSTVQKAEALGPVNRDLLGRIIPDRAAAAGAKAVEDFAVKGYEVWGKGLGGMNPSQFTKFISEIPEAERLVAQRGMFLSLQENIANMGRLTKAGRENLLSPAGQARLAETFRGLPPEYLANFNRMVEQGQFQNMTRFLIAASLAFPWARKAGKWLTDRAEGGVW